MHLFGDSNSPHLTHFEARREAGFVELGWDVRNAPALRWRVLRSESEFAATADAQAGSGQTLVMKGGDTYVMDDQVVPGTAYFYTVFAQDEKGSGIARSRRGWRTVTVCAGYIPHSTNGRSPRLAPGNAATSKAASSTAIPTTTADAAGDPGTWGSWGFKR